MMNLSRHIVGFKNVRVRIKTRLLSTPATHRLGEALWVLGGRYDYRLSKASGNWRLTSLTMTALWETGDRGLIELATKRTKTGK